MKTKPNDSAHPANDLDDTQSGLTKREYFSAMAMQGFINYCFSNEMDEAHLAKWSVIAADALIAELNKE